MALEHTGYIDLPPHAKRGGFDHAAVHQGTGRLYVAHTANDALDVIDCRDNRYLHSIPDLSGIAGVLVSEDQNLVFTSNRGGNTVGILSAATGGLLEDVRVGIGPNGLAYDPGRRLLLAANVGDPAIPGSHTVSMVDVEARSLLGHVAVSGRTRWAIFDPETEAFCINIADPPEIAVVEAKLPDHVHRTFPIPAKGPHGLDLDPKTHRLFCGCDEKMLFALDAGTGRIFSENQLSGVPDVIFFNAALRRLYVAIGDPGVIEVFETEALRRLQTVQTERGAHTIAFDPTRNTVYAFLPETHRAAIYRDAWAGVGTPPNVSADT
jgi:DNA-binding beta-propeller fold protein YncE